MDSPLERAASLCGLLPAFPVPVFLAPLAEPPSKKSPPLLSRGVGALTGAGLGLQDLQQEDDDGQQVGDVPQDAEDVHGAGGARLGRRERAAFCGQGE